MKRAAYMMPRVQLGCASVVGVESGDTCIGIASKNKLSITYFDFINPNLNCVKLFVGQWICVNGS